MSLNPRSWGYIVSCFLHVSLFAWGLVNLAFAPKKFEILDAIPVEIVTDLPQAMEGVKAGEKAPIPQKVVEKIAPAKPEEDEDDEPVKNERIKKAETAPPPRPQLLHRPKNQNLLLKPNLCLNLNWKPKL